MKDEPTADQPQPGIAWGDPIDAARKQELWARLRLWWDEADHGERKGPFEDEPLTGTEVFWLAVCAQAQSDGTSTDDAEKQIRVVSPFVYLKLLRLNGAYLTAAQLQEADLSFAQLQETDLSEAQLQGAVLDKAQLQEADLREAQLQGADLYAAQLQGADLRRATLNGGTRLVNTVLCAPAPWWSRLLPFPSRQSYAPALGDIRWNGVATVDLTQISDWDRVQRLGDEQYVSWRDNADEHQAVVRAYRQVATQLRAQGMSEVADRLSHRALAYERRVFLRRGNIPRYLGSWLLALLAGYGYRPLYTIFWYLVVIALFAATYHAYGTGCAIPSLGGFLAVATNGQACAAHPLTWYESFVVSLTAFHGRGFFATTFKPGDPQAGFAALEAVIGLLIEISFIATFTQRFFGSK